MIHSRALTMSLRPLMLKHAGLNMGSTRFMSVVTLSDTNALSKFTSGSDKSIVYFTASWCPPCKMISPLYEKFSKEYTAVKFSKVDVDENDGAAMQFEIR